MYTETALRIEKIYHTAKTKKGDCHFYVKLIKNDFDGEKGWREGRTIFFDYGERFGLGGKDSPIGERKEKITHRYESMVVKQSYFVQYKAYSPRDFIKKSNKYARNLFN